MQCTEEVHGKISIFLQCRAEVLDIKHEFNSNAVWRYKQFRGEVQSFFYRSEYQVYLLKHRGNRKTEVPL